jgi:hypothetical protein
MAKNILQDIVPPEKRSIRNVPVPSRKGRFGSAPLVTSPLTTREYVEEDIRANHEEEENNDYVMSDNSSPHIYPYEEDRNTSSKYSKKNIWIACGVALMIVLITVFSLFNSATVTVTPNKETLKGGTIVFSAYKGTQGTGVLYQIVTITKDLGKVVPATGSVAQSVNASGQIIIYNNYSSGSQKLIANTRFETPEGLIFRIKDAVVVPGKSTQNGIVLPGSLTVTVYADQPGDTYNIPLKDFTIPGFKNSPQYKSIYARSKTPMTGGFVGTVKNVSPSDLATAKTSIDADLKVALTQELPSQVPNNFISFTDGMFNSFSSLPQSEGSDKSVQVNERGTLTAIIFDQTALTTYIEQTIGSKYVNTPNTIASINSLLFAIQSKDTFDPNRDSILTFTLNGDINVVSSFDQAKLATDLAGKSKSDLSTVLAQYPGIASARAVVRPFWKGSFPSDAKKISIVIAK